MNRGGKPFNKSSMSSWPKAANFKLSIQSDFLSYQNLCMLSKGVQLKGLISLNCVCEVAVAHWIFSFVCHCPSRRFHRCLEKKLLPPIISCLTDSHLKTNPSASTCARQCLHHSMLSLYSAPTLPCARSQPQFSQTRYILKYHTKV